MRLVIGKAEVVLGVGFPVQFSLLCHLRPLSPLLILLWSHQPSLVSQNTRNPLLLQWLCNWCFLPWSMGPLSPSPPLFLLATSFSSFKSQMLPQVYMSLTYSEQQRSGFPLFFSCLPPSFFSSSLLTAKWNYFYSASAMLSLSLGHSRIHSFCLKHRSWLLWPT